ncbi:MAG: exodeoxyribonuclease VII small subunit [Desulfuromonadales bacterium]|nr:exodeoxyribonuclease VII small subunit [Desulfuromonadales bacterium]
MSKKNGFEAALQRLEDAVEQLESGELSLEKALAVFSAGVKEADLCRESLRTVELKVEQLLLQADGSEARVPLNGH